MIALNDRCGDHIYPKRNGLGFGIRSQAPNSSWSFKAGNPPNYFDLGVIILKMKSQQIARSSLQSLNKPGLKIFRQFIEVINGEQTVNELF